MEGVQDNQLIHCLNQSYFYLLTCIIPSSFYHPILKLFTTYKLTFCNFWDLENVQYHKIVVKFDLNPFQYPHHGILYLKIKITFRVGQKNKNISEICENV
jgi:hypothetical protein